MNVVITINLIDDDLDETELKENEETKYSSLKKQANRKKSNLQNHRDDMSTINEYLHEQSRNDTFVISNNQNNIPIVTQPTTRCGLRVYKIVVLGDGGVGKSAVTLQFVSHSFLDYHDPTIEDSYQQQAVIDGEPALLDILDTAGQVEFTAMRDQYMRCGEGFMICYSVTDRHSFQEAIEYRKLISRVRAQEDIPLVLVGNKFDLQHQRKVSTEEGKALARQLGCPFYETSAALRHFVDDAFHSLVRQIRTRERPNGGMRKHSRWWRLRSIFAFVFRRSRHRQGDHYSP